MRRYYHLRYDIYICLLLAFLISYIPAYFVEKHYENNYSNYVEEHKVDEGEIGGKAKESIPRVESVEELLKHDTFTIISKGIQYRNRGAGYYNGQYMYAVTLPSGELVAARINMDSVVNSSGDSFRGEAILPVGKIVKEDLTSDKTFLSQIEYKEKLSRTDFYIDMLGTGGKVGKEDYVETPKLMVQIITVILGFILLHSLGSKIGIFPRFLPEKKQKKNEWD